MPYLKLTSGTIVFVPESQMTGKYPLATEDEIAAAGFAPPATAGPARESRRMAEQLRWERETAVTREAKEKATGDAWKH